MPVSEEDRGHLWSFGRLMALSLLYRSPCPVPLSLLLSEQLRGGVARRHVKVSTVFCCA